MAEHQRARIHAATTELVDEGGYEALTVTGIARAAGVSSHTFYENFADKEDCFRATYDLIVRHTVREILAARICECGSEAKIRAGFHAFVREVSDN
ncbi:MAG: TetR/AcrR family transcriptional regulator, partial [Solirubrobacterales bacterium]